MNTPNYENKNDSFENFDSQQTPASPQPTSAEYHWKNDYPTGQPSAQSSWQPSYYTTDSASFYRNTAVQTTTKKTGKPLKIFFIFLACLLSCAIISSSSIAIFVNLINRGKITLVNTGTGSEPAYTITKVIDNRNEPAASSPDHAQILTEQEISEKILPSIVCIQNYQTSSSQFFFNPWQDDTSLSPAGEGSGIIISEDGYIITNAHVINGADSLKVVSYDGSTYEAKLIGSDNVTDLAVIKIEATGLTVAEFGLSSDLKVGDKVIAAGNPGGMEFGFSITVGYVSALNRSITSTDTGYTMNCIQTDAAVNPGNSGGALVNQYGQVVGIVSSKIVATSYEGLSFAIPSDDAQSIVSDLKAYGYVKDRAVLGVSGGYIDSVTARFYGLSSGWFVNEITTTLAADSGIQKGDVITQIDGTAITSSTSISSVLAKKEPGDTVTVVVFRSLTNETLTIDIVLSESTGRE